MARSQAPLYREPMTAILVIDTIGPWCAAALDHAGATRRDAREIGRGHAEVLAPMVEDLIGAAGLSPRELARIGVNIGPGGFAGTRVGVAFARGLALSTGAQAVGVGALDALARRADPHREKTVMAIHDARRGELIWSIIAHGACVSGLQRGDSADALAELEAYGDIHLTGSGAALLGADPAHFDPSPPLDALLALTREAPDDAPAPAPLYARPPDAKAPGGAPIA
ncbi:MAG: tRNA (adenosine(37)-N6)-threonylcarbamoyltransferase complex dimerization subunit type 1 TsaB [Oceanicaulis sp.]